MPAPAPERDARGAFNRVLLLGRRLVGWKRWATVGVLLALGVAGTSMVTDVSNWLARGSPDLRFSHEQQEQGALEFLPTAPFERDGDKVVQTLTATFRFRITNLSRTSGFINRVELVPLSPRMPRYEIASITRRDVQRGEVELIEVTALLHRSAELMGPAAEEVDYVFLVRPFDNEGRMIERLPSGVFCRLKVSGKMGLTRKITPLAP